jgi:hypothetical protein
MSISILLLGLLSAGFIIGAIELLRLDKLAAGSLILTAIGFIYVGFSGDDLVQTTVNSAQALGIWLLAYGGLRKNALLIPLGLVLHAAWDLGYLFVVPGASIVPEGYELYCVVVDLVLAGYFYYCLRKTDNP